MVDLKKGALKGIHGSQWHASWGILGVAAHTSLNLKNTDIKRSGAVHSSIQVPSVRMTTAASVPYLGLTICFPNHLLQTSNPKGKVGHQTVIVWHGWIKRWPHQEDTHRHHFQSVWNHSPMPLLTPLLAVQMNQVE